MFIDTHLHFSKEYFEDLEEIHKQSLEAEVEKLITCGCDYHGIAEINEILNKYENIYGAIGYHPSEIGVTQKDMENLEELFLKNNKIVALGEIGLDYYYDKSDVSKLQQKENFIQQLNIAKRLDKPVIIHMRESTNDVINILSKYNLKGVIHCFSGSYETAKSFIKMGFKLGIGGTITFKNSNLPEVIRMIPLESIILETDSPYLSPEPFRGHLNTPANIFFVAKKIAEIKNIDINEVGKITTNNAVELFDLR